MPPTRDIGGSSRGIGLEFLVPHSSFSLLLPLSLQREAGEAEEVRQEIYAVVAEVGLRVELDTEVEAIPIAESHDLPIFG